MMFSIDCFLFKFLDRFSVGQNVAVAWTFEKPSPNGDEPEFKRQIEAWFNEVTQIGFRPQDIEPFTFNRQAGHYSQVNDDEHWLCLLLPGTM